MYPVIIDNLMNLELLENAYKLSQDSLFDKIANSHATITITNHFRPDYSSCHVVDYDTITNKALKWIPIKDIQVLRHGHVDKRGDCMAI